MTNQRKISIGIIVNNRAYEAQVKPNETLLKYLRDQLHLKSVKAACWQGDCGLCTVLLDGVPVKSCLVLAYEAGGKEVLTVEGILKGKTISKLQKSFVQHGAVQCGFCTPAFLIMGHYLLSKGMQLTRPKIQQLLNGIICRCTGYDQIIDSILTVSNRSNELKSK